VIVINILLCGHNRTATWRQVKTGELCRAFCAPVSIYFLDNKSGEVYCNGLLESRVSSDDVNSYFEFSSYSFLLELISSRVTESDAILLCNDTIFDHHISSLWLKVIDYYLARLTAGVILGDARSDAGYSYLSSWVYLFRAGDLSSFLSSLQEAIICAKSVEQNYEVDCADEYAKHLEPFVKQKLMSWLFSDKLLRGWEKSTRTFESMPGHERYRKGISIYIEHELSKQLKAAGFALADFKSEKFLGKVCNVIDRAGSLFRKVCRRLL